MVNNILEFFGIMGVDLEPPETMSELIPYVLIVILAICVVWFVLRMFQYFVGLVIGGKRFL